MIDDGHYQFTRNECIQEERFDSIRFFRGATPYFVRVEFLKVVIGGWNLTSLLAPHQKERRTNQSNLIQLHPFPLQSRGTLSFFC